MAPAALVPIVLVIGIAGVLRAEACSVRGGIDVVFLSILPRLAPFSRKARHSGETNPSTAQCLRHKIGQELKLTCHYDGHIPHPFLPEFTVATV